MPWILLEDAFGKHYICIEVGLREASSSFVALEVDHFRNKSMVDTELLEAPPASLSQPHQQTASPVLGLVGEPHRSGPGQYRTEW